MKRSREEQIRETKKAIIEAAVDLFSSRDFNSVTTEEIANKANVAKGTLFHHYDSKENLVFEVINQVNEEMLERINKLQKQHEDPLVLLEEITTSIIKMTMETPAVTQLILQLSAKFDYYHPENESDQFKELIDKFYGSYMQKIMEIFSSMGFENPEIQTRIYFAFLDGIAIQLFIERRADDDKLVTQLIEEMMVLIKSRRDK